MGASLVTIVRNFSIQAENFPANDSSVLDECVTPGSHRVLRFEFLTHNAGDVDLIVGPPPPLPPSSSPFVRSQSHHHYHLRDFHEYRLLNLSDQQVMPGFKQASCLMDIERTNPNAPRIRYLSGRPNTA
jgi:hypothetical protein